MSETSIDPTSRALAPSRPPIGPFTALFPAVPGWHSYQVASINFVQTNLDSRNADALQRYNTQCASWQFAARQIPPGQPLPPKPQQPPKSSITIQWDPDQKESIDQGTSDLYITQTEGPELLGEPCPDLPAPPPAGNIHVGVHLVGTDYYQAFADDSAPVGTKTTAPDGTPVTKVFLPHPFGLHGIYKITAKVTPADLEIHP